MNSTVNSLSIQAIWCELKLLQQEVKRQNQLIEKLQKELEGKE